MILWPRPSANFAEMFCSERCCRRMLVSDWNRESVSMRRSRLTRNTSPVCPRYSPRSKMRFSLSIVHWRMSQPAGAPSSAIGWTKNADGSPVALVVFVVDEGRRRLHAQSPGKRRIAPGLGKQVAAAIGFAANRVDDVTVSGHEQDVIECQVVGQVVLAHGGRERRDGLRGRGRRGLFARQGVEARADAEVLDQRRVVAADRARPCTRSRYCFNCPSFSSRTRSSSA
jgi:hypothetical protein